MNKKISLFMLMLFTFNIISPILTIAEDIPQTNVEGYSLSTFYWDNFGLQVYGTPGDVKVKFGSNDRDAKTGEWRYLGFTFSGAAFSNEKFPDDYPEIDFTSANWIFKPWNNSVIKSSFNLDKNNKLNTDISTKEWLDELMDLRVKGTDSLWGYAYIQSPPRTFKAGSIRMFHNDGGHYKYRTFSVPSLEPSIVEDTPFTVTTTILSSDFVIDENESTVEIEVNVKGVLEDESYISDDVLKVKHYTREDIKEWYIKLEYKDESEYVKIDTNSSNTADETFKIKLNRSDISNGEKITFTGIGRLVFYNDKYYRDSDSKEKTITVKKSPIPVELPPDVSIKAPSQENINENYTVEVVPYIPPGESISSIKLERSFNSGSWVNLSLGNNKATEKYSIEGIVSYRATVTLTNGKSQTSNATTSIVDLREATAKASIDLPSYTYEGHWVTAYNKSKFYFESKTYSAQEAENAEIGDSDWSFYDSSKYDLGSNDYDTRNFNDEVSTDIKFNNTGDYKVGITVEPKNGVENEDVKSIKVLKTPKIDAVILGSKKANRKQTVKATINVNPDYPLYNSKLYIEIKDKVTGEKVKVTTSQHPDSTNIKTKNLVIENNTYQVILTLDYLIKTTIDKDYQVTIYAQDSRGENDTEIKNITTKVDQYPTGGILASDVAYRDSNGIANIKITKDGHSIDGDFLKLNNLKYKFDSDNDGSFNDEGFVSLSSDRLEKQVTLTTDKVGKMLLDYEFQEDLTPSTISEFVTDSDYLKKHVTKVVTVDNLAPHTSLRLINNEKIDMLVVGMASDKGTIQSEIEKMKNSLNAGSVVVDTKDSVSDANMDNKILDISSINVSYAPEELNWHYNKNGKYYYYTDAEGNITIRKFDNLLFTKEYKKTDSNGDRTAFIIEDKDTYVIRKNGYKYNFQHEDLETGEIYSFDCGTSYNISINEKGKKANIIYVGSYIYDLISHKFVDLTGLGVSGNISREGNKLYYIEKDASNYYGAYYRLKYLDIDTGSVHTEIEYHNSDYYSYGGGYYTYVNDTKVAFLDGLGSKKGYRIVSLDLKTKTFKHEIDVEIDATYRDDVRSETYHYYLTADSNITYDDVNDIYYVTMRTWYKYYHRRREDNYWWIFEHAYKLQPKTKKVLLKKQLSSYYAYKYLSKYKEGHDSYKYINYIYYKNRLYQVIRTGDSWRRGYGIYDTNYNGIEGYPMTGPMYSLTDLEIAQLHGDGRREELARYYNHKDNGSYEIFEEIYVREDGGRDYRTLIAHKSTSMGYKILEDSKGTKWAFVTAEGIWGYYGIVQHTYVMNLETYERYDTDIFDSGSKWNIFISNDKIWFFSDIRNGHFDIETKEFKPISDIIGYNLDLTYWSIVDGNSENLQQFNRSNMINHIRFYKSFKESIIKQIESFNPRSNTEKYVVILADTSMSLSSTEIDEISNMIKSKGAKCIWLGNSTNYSTGNSIASKTGGQYYNHSSIANGFTTLKNHLSYRLPKKEALYTTRVKVGEEISYDKFYFDLEKDVQIPSTETWYYRKQGGSSWSQSTPKTVFTESGIFYASWGIQDNPKPANTNSRFSSYRKNAIREEMQIIVGNVDPPVEIIDSEIDISIDGSLIVNREVKFDVDIKPGTKELSYSTLSISFSDSSNVLPSSTSTTEFSKIFKVAKTYNVTASIRDIEGKLYGKTKAFTIGVDSPITLDVSLSPSENHRNKEGKAYFDVTVNANSPDDYIKSIKHYLVTDNDNDNVFDDESPVELSEYEDLREFKLEINAGVGKYRLKTEAVEGFNEPTLDAYITHLDYHRANVSNNLDINNYIPMLEFRTDKDVYLVGEEIKYISNFDDTELNGDITKAYYDIEDDEIDELEVKYIQDKSVMPSQDSTSVYHNVKISKLLTSLDKSGEYNIESYAIDNPKPSNPKFDSYKKESSMSKDTIIVHYRPEAKLSFISSHATESSFDFGSNQYLEGTNLKIMDNSSDPDGFNVTSAISYKINSGTYGTVNSGASINLQYGNIYTIKVTAEDNWGASDTEVYTVNVVNGLEMVPDINPNPVAASEEVSLKLATNQYATSARAVIFGNNVDLELVFEDITQRIWEMQYTIPASKADNKYEVEFYAMSEGLVELREDKDLIVETPINLLVNMPTELIIDTSYTIGAETTKYADDVIVNIFSGEDFEDTISLDNVSAGTEKIWSKEYIVPIDVPEGDYFAQFIARTENGNSEVVVVPIKTISIKLENLRIVEIRDYSWKDYFIDADGKATNLSGNGIQVTEMPVYENKEGKSIKLGYKLYFKIDSMGLSDMDDTIKVSPSFYALEEGDRLIEADIYVEDDNSGDYKLIETSDYKELAADITLDFADRNTSESDAASSSKNTWHFKYYIPPTAKVVEEGEELDIINDNTKKYKLLLVFDIVGRKNNGAEFNYTEKEVNWPLEKSECEYGRNKPSATNLTGYGFSHGEVFYYDLNETLIDDLKFNREW